MLLKLFDFLYSNASAEVEVECALLQQKVLLDIVLSEDVDVLHVWLYLGYWELGATEVRITVIV